MIDISKTEWTDGPWKKEPDKEIWIDRDTDLPCVIVRHRGTWCGYVGVPPSHPTSGLCYYKSEFSIEEIKGNIHNKIETQNAINEICVHGGLTFSGNRSYLFTVDARCRDWHFFGFDCNHAGDFDPLMDAYWRDNKPALRGPLLGEPTGWGDTVKYRDITYAKEQCQRLARQLHDITP